MKKTIKIDIYYPNCDSLNITAADLMVIQNEVLNQCNIVQDVAEGRFEIDAKIIKPDDEEELDKIAIKNCPYHDNDNLETAYFVGFKAGADYRHNSGMLKLKSVLNTLMVDTRDKAAIISLMGENYDN